MALGGGATKQIRKIAKGETERIGG